MYFWNDNQILLKKLFEKSILHCIPDIELIPIEFKYKVTNSDFGTIDFRNLMLEKTKVIKEYIYSNIKNNSEILISDIDIIVYNDFTHLLRLDNIDILFQKERQNGGINTGFIYLRCSQKTYELWNEVEYQLINYDPSKFINEQKIINDKINNYNLIYKLFDDRIWAFSNKNKPDNILLHHANCTAPTNNKSSYSLKCEQLLLFLENSSFSIKDDLIEMIKNSNVL